ncbi:MAG: hypothetical protein Q7S05_03630 [bacterium]|nr:hypothetical protein [bacterium]
MENRSALKVLGVIVLLVVSNYISWNIGKNGSVGTASNVGGAAPDLPTPPGGIRVLGGTVDKVSDSGFTMTAFAYDPFASKGPSTRTVSVDANTVIERLIQKDSATMQKEQTAFMEKLKDLQSAKTAPSADAPPLPPEPFTREEGSLKDLKAGDVVSVAASEDISTAKEFVAARVSIQPSASIPSMPPVPSATEVQPK